MPLAFSAHAGSMLAAHRHPGEHHRQRRRRGCRARRVRLLRVRARRRPAASSARSLVHRRSSAAGCCPSATARACRWTSCATRALLRAAVLAARHGQLVGPSSGVTEVVVAPRSPLIGLHALPRHGDTRAATSSCSRRNAATSTSKGTDDHAAGRRHAAAAGHLGRADAHTPVARGARRRRPRAAAPAVPLGRGAKRAIVILAAMVLLLATGLVPPAIAGAARGRARSCSPGRSPSTAGVPRDLVDDGRAHRRDDPAVDGLHLDRHRRPRSPTGC